MKSKQVKENIDIVITEDNTPLIEDVEIILNTSTSRRASFTTDILNGYLEAVIIDTTFENNIQPPRIGVDIAFANNDVPIFRIADIGGFHYIPLSVGQVDFSGAAYTTGVIYALNDKLKISINGNKHLNIKIKFRMRKR